MVNSLLYPVSSIAQNKYSRKSGWANDQPVTILLSFTLVPYTLPPPKKMPYLACHSPTEYLPRVNIDGIKEFFSHYFLCLHKDLVNSFSNPITKLLKHP